MAAPPRGRNRIESNYIYYNKTDSPMMIGRNFNCDMHDIIVLRRACEIVVFIAKKYDR